MLALDDARVSVPWEGTSPRALTRGHRLVILGRKAPPRMYEAVDPMQLQICPTEQKPAPHVWGGVPSLLDQPRRT